MRVREARPDDRLAVRRVLDGALLAVDDVPARIEAGDVLVAVEDDRVIGACVLVAPADAGPDWVGQIGADAHVEAIAVRRRRRGAGIGRALIESASDRGRLSAAFEPDVRSFYDDLGFEILDGRTPDGRLIAVSRPDAP
jgi:GNAT superfamily N-acetyltransferase